MNQSRTMPGARDVAVLLLILLLAAGLRIVGLDAPLWFDEITTVDSHLNLPWGEMVSDYSMNHHYFFSLKAKLAAEVFGAESWAYRLPAALFGLGTVGAIWWLARDVGNTVIAHVSALLVALSYHQVWFSQSARGYTELAFWSTLGLIFFLRGTRHPSLSVWIGFGLTAAAAIFTHLTGAFFFVGLGLIWLISLATGFGRGELTRAWIIRPLIGVALATVLIIAVYAPLFSGLLDSVSEMAANTGTDPMQEYLNPIWTIFEGIRTAVGGPGALAQFIGIGAFVSVILGTFAAHRGHPLLGPAIWAHVVVTVVMLQMLNMRIWPRFFFVDIGLLFVLLVIGCHFGAEIIAKIARRPGLTQGLFALSVIIMVGLSVFLVGRNYSAPKQDLAGAFNLVEAERGPGDRAMAFGPSAYLYRSHFNADWEIIIDQDDYDAVMATPGTVFVVVTFPRRNFRVIPGLPKDVDEARLEHVASFPGTLGDGNIFIYRRD